jgi:hypothetical protein
VFSLAHSVVSSLLGSQGGSVLDSLGQESDSLDGLSELSLGVGEETLGVDDSLLTLDLRGGVRISGVGGAGDLSLADHGIFVVLSVGSGLLVLSLADELIDESDNIINDTLGSEVNL